MTADDNVLFDAIGAPQAVYRAGLDIVVVDGAWCRLLAGERSAAR